LFAAIRAKDCNLKIVNSVITNCTSPNEGGALYAERSIVNATSSSFLGNSAVQFGGSIYAQNTNVTLQESTFKENYSTNGSGGAIFCGNSSSVAINQCVVSYNTAYKGGAVYCEKSCTFKEFESGIYDNNSTSGDKGNCPGISF